MAAVDAGPGAVVGTAGVDPLGGGEAALVFGPRLRGKRVPVTAPGTEHRVQPEHCVGTAKQGFRHRHRLGEHEPVEIGVRDRCVDPVEHRLGRHDVEQSQAGHRVGPVERHPVGDTRAAVMPGDSEGFVAKRMHQRDHVGRP